MKSKPHYTSRKIARSMARYRMKRNGFRKMNRTAEKFSKSPFQIYWRDYVFQRSVTG